MNNRIKLTQIERYYFYIIIVSYFGYFYNLISRARWFWEYFMKKGGAFGRGAREKINRQRGGDIFFSCSRIIVLTFANTIVIQSASTAFVVLFVIQIIVTS